MIIGWDPIGTLMLRNTIGTIVLLGGFLLLQENYTYSPHDLNTVLMKWKVRKIDGHYHSILL